MASVALSVECHVIPDSSLNRFLQEHNICGAADEIFKYNYGAEL